MWIRNMKKWSYLVVGEAGIVGSSEGGEAIHLEGADCVTTARGELPADGVDAISIYVRTDGAAPPSVQGTNVTAQVDSWTGVVRDYRSISLYK